MNNRPPNPLALHPKIEKTQQIKNILKASIVHLSLVLALGRLGKKNILGYTVHSRPAWLSSAILG